ncbi:MAG TPA: ABC transporter ATP-binding protein [Opitutaceae bacterium]|jgi:ABC-2 type transport system ATP-binding protein|nr:ABC transporter ATP-binding protein [Opitutaceae bacterium]HOR25535.1 ABC transporter ATP-binding protein [Opitutaceae bacterium]HPK49660.1 ABC transporter ATP-binding protein [Opitutaceae bacterium]
MPPLLQIDHLAKAYGPVRAVQDISFSVRPGEIYGLLGPNGAGKTTTISMVSGLLSPDGGSIAIAGRPLAADPQAAKRLMGVVPQELALYEELSAAENLEFWGRLAGLDTKTARARTAEILAALTLSDRARDPVKTFSGGMKRRVNLGCALLHRPKLILLDEPTVGIDPQARLNILEFVRSLRADGVGVLYTTHYLEEAESLCDRIGIVDHGRMHAEGTLRELQERLGGQRLFVLEGQWTGAEPDTWPGLRQHYRVLQHTDRQLVVAALDERDPADCLRELLALPVRAENVTLKRPSLNDVFLHLTGRDLRE